MPIDYKNYPETWHLISQEIRFLRAKGHCEGSPAYPDCRAKHGEPHPVTGSIVILTVGHLDHDPDNNEESNLRAWCQRCHLTYDAKIHTNHAAETRRRKHEEAGQLRLVNSHGDDLPNWEFPEWRYHKGCDTIEADTETSVA